VRHLIRTPLAEITRELKDYIMSDTIQGDARTYMSVARLLKSSSYGGGDGGESGIRWRKSIDVVFDRDASVLIHPS